MSGKNSYTAYNSNETSWADQWDPEPASYTSFDKKTGNNNSSKISSKVGDTLGKTKYVASTGVKKFVLLKWIILQQIRIIKL